MAHDVFICYSSKDKTTADAVCAVLESEGIRCWIAPRDILVGMSYGEAIVDAIHNAKALVLVFSGHANASPQIEREVERAINKRIPVIPLRIEDVAPDKALEYFLSTPHWLDAFTPPLERHLRNLAGQIHRLIVTDDKARAAKDAGASPFKTVQTPEPPPTPEPPKPAQDSRPMALMGVAAAGAAAASAAGPESAASSGIGGTASGGSVPRASSTGSGAAPLAWFNGLDMPQKVGIGAGVLALLIGVGWLASSSGSNPTPPPTPMVSVPGVTVGPNGVVVDGGDGRVSVGPNGVQVTPRTGYAPDDGNTIPGRTSPRPNLSGGATGNVYPSVTGSDIASVLTEAGYEATTAVDNQGDPMVNATMEGLKFNIFFYRCERGSEPKRCLDLQFHAAFENDRNVGDDKLNAYNRDNRFGQAYRMANGELGLDMSATLQGGVSRQHIKEVIDWWKVTLTNFPKKMGSG